MLSMVGRAGQCTYLRSPSLSIPVSANWTIGFATHINRGSVLGLSGNFLNFSFYHNALEYTGHLQAITYQIYSVWGWCMLATNTFLTGAMIWRITCALLPFMLPWC